MPTKCFSIAERPSVYGKTLFTAAFAARNMDWTYEPLEVRSESRLKDALGMLRTQGRGCGVSMPWKTVVPRFLDTLDPKARRLGAVNTIVHEKGMLVGYNTDYLGALAVYKGRFAKGAKALVCGSGGVARAQVLALTELGLSVTVSALDAAQGKAFVQEFSVPLLPWKDRTSFRADLLVNCTPVGMAPDVDGIVIPEERLGQFRVVADMVIKPARTRLITAAEQAGCVVIPGTTFALEQAIEQFRLYTGQAAPREEMERALRTIA